MLTMKLTTVILILFATSLNLWAQGVQFDWAHDFGSNQEDHGYCIDVDSSGNVYSIGEFTGTVDFDPGPGVYNLTSLRAVYILKLDSLGEFVWAKNLETFFNPISATIAPDGNLIYAGYFNYTVDFDPGPGISTLTANGSNAFISKLDSNGNFMWAKQFQGTSQIIEITTDTIGNIFSTGIYNDSVDFDPGVGEYWQTINGGYHSFISKLNANGNFIWAKNIGGTSETLSYSIAAGSAGNIYLTGNFSDTTDFDPDVGVYNLISYGNPDIFLLKLDSAGTFLWANNFGGNELSGVNIGSSLSIDHDENIYLTGNFTSTVDFDPGSGMYNLYSPGHDSFIAKYTNNGNFVWVKAISGTYKTTSLSLDHEGNIYTVGYYEVSQNDFDPGPALYELSIDYKAYLSKLDSVGNFVFAKGIVNKGWPAYPTIPLAIDKKGNIIISGAFEWNPDFDPGFGIYNLTGENIDAFVLKLKPAIQTKSTINASFCDSVVSPSGNYIWTSPGSYIDIIPNNLGGDSVMTFNLSLSSHSSSSIYVTGCNYMSPSGNYTWSTSGIYYDTIANTSGCDSIITIYLEGSTSSTVTTTFCGSYISPSGNQIWHSTGTYMDTITNAIGCDSIITINLFETIVDTSVTQTGNSLIANAAGATYQWIDCQNGNAPIPGENSSTFTASANGSFAVIVTKFGCTDTSSCHTITMLEISDPYLFTNIKIYPNPANDQIQIDLGGLLNKGTIELINITGQVLIKKAFLNQHYAMLDIHQLPKSEYLVRVIINDETAVTRRFIKEY